MVKIKDMTLDEKNEYHRKKNKEWRLKNPERNRELRKKYKQSEKGKITNNKYHKKRMLNPETKEYHKKRMSNPKTREEYRDYQRDYHKKRYAENPETKEHKREYMSTYFKDEEKRKKNLIRQKTYQKFLRGLIKKERCDKCGSKENLEIHHIEYNNEDNILILCRKCHRKLHRIDELN